MLDMADWDIKQVQRWLDGIGMRQYADDFKWHHISGESLMIIDHEDLEDVGVRSLGHRIRLLMAINKHLHRDNVNLSCQSVPDLVNEVSTLNLRIKKLTESHIRLRQDMLPVIRRAKEQEPLPTPLSAASPTHAHTRRGPSVSPSTDGPLELNSRTSSRLGGAITPSGDRANRLGLIEEDNDLVTGSFSSQGPPIFNGPQVVHAHVKSGAPISLSTASEPFKSFRVALDDPCTKVLPAVLKKYRIHDDPSNYRLLVSYGDRERELRTDEKPLHVFKELQDSGVSPVFMVRQIVKSSAALTPSGKLTPGGVI